MENKKLNEIYERPLVELIDLQPEGVLCDSGEGMDAGDGEEGL